MTKGYQPTGSARPQIPTTGSGVKPMKLRDEPDFVHTQRFEPSYQEMIAARDREIATLRRALREIADMPVYTSQTTIDTYDRYSSMRTIARAALTLPQPQPASPAESEFNPCCALCGGERIQKRASDDGARGYDCRSCGVQSWDGGLNQPQARPDAVAIIHPARCICALCRSDP